MGGLATPRPAVPGAPGSVGSAGDAPEACVHPLPHQAADREGCHCAAQFEKMPSGWRPPPAMVRPGMGGGGLAGSASWLACTPTPSQGPPRLCPDSTLLRRLWGEERCEGRRGQLCAPGCQGDAPPILAGLGAQPGAWPGAAPTGAARSPADGARGQTVPAVQTVPADAGGARGSVGTTRAQHLSTWQREPCRGQRAR